MQKYYCDNDAVHPDPIGLDFGQFDTYYKTHEVDAELTRLSARVAELESGISLSILIEAAKERESLLLECLRWCIEVSPYLCDDGSLHTLASEGPIQPPSHLAPMISEAVQGTAKTAEGPLAVKREKQ